MNSIVARDSLLAAGAMDFQAADVDSTADHGDCYEPAMSNTLLFFLGFQQIGTVSIDDPTEQNRLHISPNPAHDVLVLKNLPAAGQLEIIDYQGKIHISTSLRAGDASVPVQHLPSGVYLAKFRTGKVVRTERVVIQK